MDADYSTAAAETGTAYLTMLAVDCLLNTVAALEKLTDVAVEGAVSPDAAAGRAAGSQDVMHSSVSAVSDNLGPSLGQH